MQRSNLLIALLAPAILISCTSRHHSPVVVEPDAMPKIGSVSERFLAYNVEMVELTGGRFWAPYEDGVPRTGDNRYQQRPPIDLRDSRLRKLAAALGPSYVRFSGTWANATYFGDGDSPLPEAPSGFDNVLTTEQWRDAVDFAQSVNAGIVTSMATSPGARGGNGEWQPDNAARLFHYTASLGATIAAAEFANEPNMIGLTQPPDGYSASDYRRDYGRFYDWIRQISPDTLVLAPGAVEMGQPMRTLAKLFSGRDSFEPAELLTAESPRPDVVSFHYYGASSQRCHIPIIGSKPADAFDPQWIAGIDDGIRRTAELRDRVAPGAPLWNTESGETACGGNPWASTFADTFRFLDQLARSARQGVQVFFHNTLAASDYAILDEHSFAPRPDYWAAWLWRELMGTTVLDAGPGADGLHIYAHCHRNIPGAVTALAINFDQTQSQVLKVDSNGEFYSLTGAAEGPRAAALNGATLSLGRDDALPDLSGQAFPAGQLRLEPASSTFIVFADASNPACQPRPLAVAYQRSTVASRAKGRR